MSGEAPNRGEIMTPDQRRQYEREADKRASKIIFDSMRRRLHPPRPFPTETENDHDPHDW